MNNLEEQKETIEVKPDEVIEADGLNAKMRKAMNKYRIERLLARFSLLIIIALYVILGLCAKGPFGPYNLNGWGFWWILFLAVPVASQTYAAICRHKLAAIPIADAVIVSYLLVGLLTGMWHPYWALIFIIPAYYIVIGKIKKK